jgi:hypothetical protein
VSNNNHNNNGGSMQTTETGITIISPRSLAEAKELASTLSAARTIPEALQKAPADVLAIVMAGAELGLAPMQSLRALVLIKGKPTLSADAMGALVKSRRDVCQFLTLDASDATRATYSTQRVGDPKPTTLSFTIEEARTAGLNGDNWRRFPAAMLRARALSAICRAVYPDLILGVYDPEELQAEAAKDVTPPPGASPPRRRHLLQREDGKVVEMASTPQTVGDVVEALEASVAAVLPQPGRTPWDDLCAAAKDNGIPWRKAADWLKATRGKGKPSEVTDDDVEAYRAQLRAEADMGGVA